jgi:hypothetical protein
MAYYQTAVGRWKKKRLNGRRHRQGVSPAVSPPAVSPPAVSPPAVSPPPASPPATSPPPAGDPPGASPHPQVDTRQADHGRPDHAMHGAQAVPASPTGRPSPLTVELQLDGVVLDELSLATSPMLPYVRMVVSLLEGVELSCREVLDLLRQSMRQRSFGARRKIDYLLGFLHQHPP